MPVLGITADSSTAPTIPGSLPGLFGWYDAADPTTITETGGNVSMWRDKSTRGYHLTAAAGAFKTGLATQNGKNVLTMDGPSTMTYTHGGVTIDAMPFTLFTVVRATQGQQFRFIWVKNSPGGLDWQAGSANLCMMNGSTVTMYDSGYIAEQAITLNVWQMWRTSAAGHGGTWGTAVNGAAVTVTHSGAVDLVQIIGVGQGATTGIIGDVAEIILCGAALSAGNVTATEDYLRTKWGTP